MEETLVRIWSEVLGLSEVGIHDNFFELGGHSLLATQVLSRVRAAFNLEIPLPTFFAEATIAGLAANVEAALQREAGVPRHRSDQLLEARSYRCHSRSNDSGSWISGNHRARSITYHRCCDSRGGWTGGAAAHLV